MKESPPPPFPQQDAGSLPEEVVPESTGTLGSQALMGVAGGVGDAPHPFPSSSPGTAATCRTHKLTRSPWGAVCGKAPQRPESEAHSHGKVDIGPSVASTCRGKDGTTQVPVDAAQQPSTSLPRGKRG